MTAMDIHAVLRQQAEALIHQVGTFTENDLTLHAALLEQQIASEEHPLCSAHLTLQIIRQLQATQAELAEMRRYVIEQGHTPRVAAFQERELTVEEAADLRRRVEHPSAPSRRPSRVHDER